MDYSSDYSSQLSRFLDRRVSVEVWRCTLWGKLVAVSDDYLRLVDTVIQGDLEGQSWFDQIQFANEDGGGLRNSETIVRMGSVQQVTCVDDAGPRDDIEAPGSSEFERLTRVPKSEFDAYLEKLRAELKQQLDDASSQADEVRAVNDRIGISIGSDLLHLADPKRGGELMDGIQSVRKQIASQTGVILPKTRVRDDVHIGSLEYKFLINGHVVASNELRFDACLAFNLDAADVDGVDTLDPVHGLKAKWIAQNQVERARSLGATVCEPVVVLQTHFAHVMKARLHEFLSFQDVLKLLEKLGESHFESIDKFVPERVPIEVLHRLIRRLLREGVSIKNLHQIIESLSYHIDQVADHAELLQRLRVDIGRDICSPLIDQNNQLHAVVLEPELEDEIAEITDRLPEATKPEAIANVIESIAPTQDSIVIVVHRSEIRGELFEAISAFRPDSTVIARQEIPKDVILVPQCESETQRTRLHPR